MTRIGPAGTMLAMLLIVTAVTGAPVTSDRLALGLPASGEPQGEVLEIPAGNNSFRAIFRARQHGQPRGGIVLLHDRATAANSLEVMRPLRLGLAQAGWDTLSLQLSSSRGDQPGDAVTTTRLRAGLDWLRTRKLTRLAVVALGDSAGAALAFAADKPPPELKALVLVSAVIEPQTTATTEVPQLPLLEVHAERDHPLVLEGIAARKGYAHGGADYSQRVVSGASAGYFGLEEGLLSLIRGWLAGKTDTPAVATD